MVLLLQLEEFATKEFGCIKLNTLITVLNAVITVFNNTTYCCNQFGKAQLFFLLYITAVVILINTYMGKMDQDGYYAEKFHFFLNFGP